MLTLVFLPNFDPIPKPTLIPIPINLEIEPPILNSHIPLIENECEFQFFYVDSTLKPNLTLEPKLDLSHIPESVLVPVPFTFEPKSIISLNYIPLLDKV